jgi:hypothetical protein
MKKPLMLFILILNFFPVYSSDLSGDAISLETKKNFNPLYPTDEVWFTFIRGSERLTLDQFITLSKDEVLIKNQELLKKTKYNGFLAAGILGGVTVSFLIPSAVFIGLQTSYYMIQSNYQQMGYNSWIDYFSSEYAQIFFPGLITIAFTIASAAALVIELIVTFSMISYYSFNEKLIKEAVNRYNRKLKNQTLLLPLFDWKDRNLITGLSWKF